MVLKTEWKSVQNRVKMVLKTEWKKVCKTEWTWENECDWYINVWKDKKLNLKSGKTNDKIASIIIIVDNVVTDKEVQGH